MGHMIIEMEESINIKFESAEGCTQEKAVALAQFFASKNLQFKDFYVPRTNTKLIVFLFDNVSDKEKIVKLPNLEDKLNNSKCKIYKPTIIEDPNDRTVFVWNLNPLYFWYTPSNSIQENNNKLLEKMNTFMYDLKAKVGDIIEDHHFISHIVKGKRYAPRQMTIVFKEKEKAKEFINQDTFFNYGILRKIHKKFNEFIPLKKCSICKMTNHRKGDPRCDGHKRCARCLSKDHLVAERCTNTPKCHTHGEGHSSGSARCPINIKYRKNQRLELANNEIIERQTSNTPVEYRAVHRDFIKSQIANKNKTYANATKNSMNPTPSVNTANTSAFSMGYTIACIAEAYMPGTFQKALDEFCDDNNLPKYKVRTPDPTIVNGIAPKPAIPNNLGRKSNLGEYNYDNFSYVYQEERLEENDNTSQTSQVESLEANETEIDNNSQTETNSQTSQNEEWEVSSQDSQASGWEAWDGLSHEGIEEAIYNTEAYPATICVRPSKKGTFKESDAKLKARLMHKTPRGKITIKELVNLIGQERVKYSDNEVYLKNTKIMDFFNLQYTAVVRAEFEDREIHYVYDEKLDIKEPTSFGNSFGRLYSPRKGTNRPKDN